MFTFQRDGSQVYLSFHINHHQQTKEYTWLNITILTWYNFCAFEEVNEKEFKSGREYKEISYLIWMPAKYPINFTHDRGFKIESQIQFCREPSGHTRKTRLMSNVSSTNEYTASRRICGVFLYPWVKTCKLWLWLSNSSPLIHSDSCMLNRQPHLVRVVLSRQLGFKEN